MERVPCRSRPLRRCSPAGALSGLLEEKGSDQAVRILFLVGAAIMVHRCRLLAVAAGRRVRTMFASNMVRDRHPMADLRRLVRALADLSGDADLAVVEFSRPASATPLQYHLQNALHASDAQWGQWNAIFAALLHSTFINLWNSVPQVCAEDTAGVGNRDRRPADGAAAVHHSVTGALIAAVADRADGRHCHRRLSGSDHAVMPAGLQGTTLMLASSLYFVCLAIWRSARHPPL